MGMRRHVALDFGKPSNPETGEGYSKIYLYTHWDADGLEKTLAKSLDRGRSRWDDEPYLARIIFTDMTEGVGDSLTGYGLSPYVTDDEYPTLEVDLTNQTVNGVSYEEFIKDPSQFAIHG